MEAVDLVVAVDSAAGGDFTVAVVLEEGASEPVALGAEVASGAEGWVAVKE